MKTHLLRRRTWPRRRLIIAGLVALPLTFAASALAVLPSIQFSGSISPTKGGSPDSPKNAKVKLSFSVNADARATVSRITYFVPETLRLDGTGFSYCTAAQINTDGVGSCSPTSQVGKGSATLLIGQSLLQSNVKIKVFAAAANEVSLALQSDTSSLPAARGIISDASGDFSQKLVIDVPASVQQPAPGVYTYLTNMTLELGADNSDKTAFFASLRGCPADGAHRLRVTLDFAPNPNPPPVGTVSSDGFSACKGP